MKPVETWRNRFACAFREKRRKLVESVKEKIRNLMTSKTSPTEVSYPGYVYALFLRGKGVETNKKGVETNKKGEQKKSK